MRYFEIVIDERNEHCTERVSARDIRQVFANGPRIRKNRKDATAEFIAEGVNDGGAKIVVPFDREGDVIRPVTAWRV